MKTISIYPPPHRIDYLDGPRCKAGAVNINADSALLEKCLARGLDCETEISSLFSGESPADRINFCIKDKSIVQNEAYVLAVGEKEILLESSSPSGVYYGLQTFRQILDQCRGELPCLRIEDGPALEIRGVLLDIGRDKIPKMETLYALVDQLAMMRINHLELYMEGYCYEWPQFRYLFSDETPMTAEELQDLSHYAASRFIDLVPNQNILGHMEKWLAKPQFNHLAECEEGFLFNNLYWRDPMTVDVRDEEALKLGFELLNDLIGNFSSSYVNVNMDEPFELGDGKNKAIAEQEGVGKLYIDYLQKVHRHLRKKGKRMILWGDVLFSHPEYIPQLPDDILVLDWIYEGDGDFEKDCKAISAARKDFCLCPGSSGWCSFTGRVDNMRKNVANAADCAVRYGGKGIILTDWGDLGHWQFLSVSYLPFAFAGAHGWAGGEVEEDIVESFCNRYVYRDPRNEAYSVAKDLGNYYQLEEASLYNTTLCFGVMASKFRFETLEEFPEKMELMCKLSQNIAAGLGINITDPEIRLDQDKLAAYFSKMDSRIAGLELECPDGDLIRKEMALGKRMAVHGMNLYVTLTTYRKDSEGLTRCMAKLYMDLDEILREYFTLWSTRNRLGGFSRSIQQFQHLLAFYRRYMKKDSI